uniref:Late expression factor-6 n=1 Tax=Dendrolimus kikuchii nucleopolyhedrovirus TaxID=1219875 RepID=V9LT00_9ABAC|nr:late expression factor-6 [Dendrolimus kikuchii nucleopolyhedrovirus]
MVFIVFYNGYHVEKRFSREFLTFIYRSLMVRLKKTQLPLDLKDSIDWYRSTRKQLYVLNKHVYTHLLQCSHRYYWPDGKRFVCRQYNDISRRPIRSTAAAVKNCQCDRKQLRRSKVIKVVDKRRRLSNSGGSLAGEAASTLQLLSSPVPADNWCDEELKLYARNNGYDESLLEEGELLDDSDNSHEPNSNNTVAVVGTLSQQ